MKRYYKLILFIPLLLVSCYPKKKVLAYFPDGRPKVIRHYKRNNPLNERLVSYYENGKKEYVKYWKNDTWRNEWIAWYPNGALQKIEKEKYKDTVRSYDSTGKFCTIHGFEKKYVKTWYENRKIASEEYSKGNQKYYFNYGDSGTCTYRYVKTVRPDGYDSVVGRWYSGKVK